MGTLKVDISRLQTSWRRYRRVMAENLVRTGDLWVSLKKWLKWPVGSSSVKIWSGLVIGHNLA